MVMSTGQTGSGDEKKPNHAFNSSQIPDAVFFIRGDPNKR